LGLRRAASPERRHFVFEKHMWPVSNMSSASSGVVPVTQINAHLGNPGQMLTKEERARKNWENTQKITGPRIPDGKKISPRNSMTHGLTATTIHPDDAPGEAPSTIYPVDTGIRPDSNSVQETRARSRTLLRSSGKSR
jgi:hypothetical protein